MGCSQMFLQARHLNTKSEACKTGQGIHNGTPAKIRDWKAFHNSANKTNKEVTDVLFRSLINTHR